MLSLIIDSIGKEYGHIRRGIRSMSSDILNGIGAIMSLVTSLASLTVFGILIARFGLGGGFGEMTSDITKISGNASGFYSTPAVWILAGLNIALLVMSFILYFRNEGLGMRIVGTLPILVVAGSFISILVMYYMDRRGSLKETEGLEKLLIVLIVASLIAAVISFILLLVREREMAGSCMRQVIFSFGLLPLVTLCIENIIALIVGAVGVFILGAVLSGDSSENSGASDVGSVSTVSSKPAVQTVSAADSKQAIYDINRRYKEEATAIVKRHGEVGAFAFSNQTNYELSQLRKRLEHEAELRGVKGKVSIY